MATAGKRAEARRTELERLTADQVDELARESRTGQLPKENGKVVRFSEMSTARAHFVELEGAERAHRQPRSWSVYLSGNDPSAWDAIKHPSSVHIFEPSEEKPGRHTRHLKKHFHRNGPPSVCPVCKGSALSVGSYCLGCDRAGLDPFDEDQSERFAYYGEPIGSRINKEYPGDEWVAVKPARPLPGAGKARGKARRPA
jgi:hypothetical protein